MIALNVAVRLGYRLDASGVNGATEAAIPADPLAVVLDVAVGDLPWPATGTFILATAGWCCCCPRCFGVALIRSGRGRTRVDRAAAFLIGPRRGHPDPHAPKGRADRGAPWRRQRYKQKH